MNAVFVFAQPVADFTANRTTGCSPITIQFTSTSTGTITSYLWNFGNGNTSSLQNPSAIYVTPGTYTVTLTVRNGSTTNTKTVTAYITVFNSPTANFSATPLSGCAPLVVSFSDISTTGSGTINSWLWDFGNGVTSTARNPTTTYTTPGSYTVSLIVRDANNCQSTLTRSAYINVSAPFTANFSAPINVSCNPPLTVNFTSTTSTPSTYTYLWDFGNGSTSTLQSPNHTYTTAGSFTVTLTITSSSGCRQTITKTAYIQIATLTANFDISTNGMCAPALVSLTNNTAPATGNSYFWSIPGFISQTGTNANLTISTPGTYNITLRSTSNSGCVSIATKSLILAQRPVADFIVNKSRFCEPPAIVNFTNNSSNTTAWNWNFGNSVGASSQNPSVTYNSPGSFLTRLIVTSPLGTNCKDTATKTIKIGKPSVFIKSQNLKSGCVPLTVNFEAIDNNVSDIKFWKWELKGVVISTNSTFFHTFLDTGIFVVKLTAGIDATCQVILYDTISVGMKLNVNFTADKLIGCFNQTKVKFTPTWIGVKPERMFWDIGGKQTAFDFEPTVTFADTGVYTITLHAVHKGCSTTVSRINYISILTPIANFTYNIDTCKTDTANFINKSAGRNKFLWNFGDSTTSRLQNPRHGYKKAGIYTINLIVNDTISGCYDTANVPITIITKPSVFFLPTDTAGCSELKVALRDSSVLDSTRTITDWLYSVFPGNTFYTGKNPMATFKNGGDYGIRLQITDNFGCKYSYTDSQAIHVYKGSANFAVAPNKGCIPFTAFVNDTARSENGIARRKWVWGNGDSTSVTDSFASYTYNFPNKTNQSSGFAMKLVVTDSLGCEFTSVRNVLPTKPTPNFTETVVKTCGKDSFRFSVTVGNNNIYLPVSVNWRLPYGGTSINPNTPFVGSGDTTLPIKLIVSDFNGCKDSITKMVNVNTKKPSIDFSANQRTISCYKSNTKITFTDNTLLGGSNVKKRKWNFGDGTIADSLPNPEKLYLKPGTYDVSLTITDSAGCTGTKTEPNYIIVGGPVGTFNFTPKKGCTPSDVLFEVNSPNARLIIWDHADGNVDTFDVDTHTYTYTRPGVYYPRLTLVDSSLACDFGYDAIDSIVVLPLPAPTFKANKTKVCKDNTIIFSNTSPPQPAPTISWKWLLGNGDTSFEIGPLSYRYSKDGIYSVSLVATDNNGCTGITTNDSYITVTDDTIPPIIPLVKRATVVNNEEVLFEYFPNTESDFDKYIIYYQNTSAQKSDISDTIFIESGLNTLEFPYSYKLAAVDVCNNQSTLSETHKTVELKTAASINAVDLVWSAYQGFDTAMIYEIWRKEKNESDFLLLTTMPSDSNYYTDTSTLCYTYYTYRIKTLERNGYYQFSWSDTSGGMPIYYNNIPTPENIRATVVNNKHVKLEWYAQVYNRPFTYLIYRAMDDGFPVFYKTLSSADTVLIDDNVDVQKHSYKYITYLADKCNGLSLASNEAKTIVLTVKMVGNDILTHDPRLTWTPYTEWENGVSHYQADFYSDSAGSYTLIARTAPNVLETFHKYVNTVQGDYCYKITGYKNGDSSILSESNLACVSTAPRLYAPNVFTINGDGLNDVFYVRGVFINTFNLKIFDRWGKNIFETNDINTGWNGTINGQVASSDVYVFIAEATGKRGEVITIQGNITLLR